MATPSKHVKRGVAQLRHRHETLAWWRWVMVHYPGGVVPLGVAARILGISGQRLRFLVREKRLPVIGPMPGGLPEDRFIPIDALIDAPFLLDVGRPGVWGVVRRQNWQNYVKANVKPGGTYTY